MMTTFTSIEMKRRRKPDARLRLDGCVLAERSESIVMRLERHPGGADGRALTVFTHVALTESRFRRHAHPLLLLVDSSSSNRAYEGGGSRVAYLTLTPTASA